MIVVRLFHVLLEELHLVEGNELVLFSTDDEYWDVVRELCYRLESPFVGLFYTTDIGVNAEPGSTIRAEIWWIRVAYHITCNASAGSF